MTENLTDDEALIRSLHVFDDGRDWTAIIVWMMGDRKRISEHTHSLPPTLPQIVKPTIKPKVRKKRRRVKPAVNLTDF
ncbi:hypothetical protein [Citrobacter braakii]|uniref:hypothetical protein n=1 Tax=Citrobacter braakii TaxID=57706 RepID=UPI0018ED238C